MIASKLLTGQAGAVESIMLVLTKALMGKSIILAEPQRMLKHSVRLCEKDLRR